MLHTKVAMKGIGRGKKSLQHSIVDLFPGIQKYTHAHTRTHTHTHALTRTHARADSNYIFSIYTYLSLTTYFFRFQIMYQIAQTKSIKYQGISIQCSSTMQYLLTLPVHGWKHKREIIFKIELSTILLKKKLFSIKA